MQRFFGFLVPASLLLLAHTALALTAPVHTLHLGDTGPDVVALQKILNLEPDTQVATTGPGSSGQESSYFGSKTADAVRRFQSKYSADVLIPAGLSSPTGFVGALTLKKLTSLAHPAQPVSSEAASTTLRKAAPTPAASTALSKPAIGIGTTNNDNLGLYIDAVTKEAQSQGVDAATLSSIIAEIRNEAATTTDYREVFFEHQREAYIKKVSEQAPHSFVGAFLGRAIAALDVFFTPQRAYASLGVPFGGYITYVNPFICNCPPGITHLFVFLAGEPDPALSNLLLDYVDGSEAFLWHNIPEPGIATLGAYAPGVLTCFTYVGTHCHPVPAEGTISPEVGSSLTPL